jgi:hypothetical protein
MPYTLIVCRTLLLYAVHSYCMPYTLVVCRTLLLYAVHSYCMPYTLIVCRALLLYPYTLIVCRTLLFLFSKEYILKRKLRFGKEMRQLSDYWYDCFSDFVQPTNSVQFLCKWRLLAVSYWRPESHVSNT